MAAKMAFAKEILPYSPLDMLQKHVTHQNRGFGGCSIKIFTLESWIIFIFRVGGHVMLCIYIMYKYRVASTIIHVVDLSFIYFHIHI